MIKIENNSFDRDQIINDGNKYLIGNGYMGYRGTLDEDTKEQLVAVNLPRVYDKKPDKWCESVNAPNPLYSFIEFQGQKICASKTKISNHYQSLDLKTATFTRKTTYEVDNYLLTITSSRFAACNLSNYFGSRYQVSANREIMIDIYTGIDGDVFDINGPHLENHNVNNHDMLLEYRCNTIERQIPVFVYAKIVSVFGNVLDTSTIFFENKLLIKFRVLIKPNTEFGFEKIAAVHYGEKSFIFDDLISYSKLKDTHDQEFEKKFNEANIIIEGDERAQLGISYSIYHLLILGFNHTMSGSIPARGISGQVYKGAIFWDTEMFMLPFFLMTDLMMARRLIQYRIDTLKGAIDKAYELGYDGAYYAWESIEGGVDACTLFNVTDPITNRPLRTYFKDKQIHISADIVYGLVQYFEATNDDTILIDGGFNVIVEVVKFYYSYLYYQPRKDRYVILDVTGPDEYHERVNNNAYTNQMIHFCFHTLIKYHHFLQAKYPQFLLNLETNELVSKINQIIPKLYLPKPNQEGLIEQFDGYFKLEDVSLNALKERMLHPQEYLGSASGLATHTQIIKQADVITMLVLFKDLYSLECLKANFDYYLTRTEHGSSLSASMYALAACELDLPNIAYQYFLDSALIDYLGKGKQYAGSIYIGGTHPAASGGAYMTVIYGFAGLRIKDGDVFISPHLPSSVRRISFKIIYQGYRYHIDITNEESHIKKELIN